MFAVRYGGKKGKTYTLEVQDELVAVRTHSRTPLRAGKLATRTRKVLAELQPVARFHDAGVEILRYGPTRRSQSARAEVRETLRKEPDCRFAGRVLADPRSGVPAVYTENLFVKFDDDESASACRKLLDGYQLTVKRELEFARNAYFLAAPEGTGRAVFDIASRLLAEPRVELCHAELVRQARRRGAFAPQWHLKKTTINGTVIEAHANVEAAWALSQGEGITIAIIDDGVDIDHEEFRSAGKIVAPRDEGRGTDNPRPGNRDDHGTACAGVACADGLHGASGVAPKARLMPVRIPPYLGTQAEADAFVWAARNGADVISCSWGPVDGDPSNPDDPLHRHVEPLPDRTRLAIEWAIRNGRSGKGCVITFAAGNGNESVDNDGYASYGKVNAIAACNDGGKKSNYSDYGRAIFCAFPSSDQNSTRTPGIWTTDRSGALGYNDGSEPGGDPAGHYTATFGGTSSASPGAAGVAALILARNPELRWDEVREVLKRSSDRIDEAGGRWDENGHSRYYGYGRVNAKKAVSLAVPAQPRYTAIHTAVQDVRIPDLKTASIAVEVGDGMPLRGLKVGVDIEHSFIGDLVVRLVPPGENGNGPVVLHNRAGQGADSIKTTFDPVNTPALAGLAGKNPKGTWTLEAQDMERQDTGKIRRFSLEMSF